MECPDILQNGECALHLSATSELEGREKMLILLKHGAHPNIKTYVSQTVIVNNKSRNRNFIINIWGMKMTAKYCL